MFSNIRLIIGVLSLAGALGGVWYYGKVQYDKGKRETVLEFLKSDADNAAQIQGTAKRVSERIGTDFDAILDELRRTGGLRGEADE